MSSPDVPLPKGYVEDPARGKYAESEPSRQVDGLPESLRHDTDIDAYLSGEHSPDAPPHSTASGRPVEPLTLDQIKGVLQIEIEDSLGGLGSEVAEQRRKSLQFYLSRPFGNEQEGRSTVILDDVRDTVEWVLPSLMKMFWGGAHIVKYKPRHPEDEAMADQATERINHLLKSELDGFQIFYEWFKSALIQKNSQVKVYQEDRYEPKVESFKGLTEEELTLLLDDGTVELREAEEQTVVLDNPEMRDPETGEMPTLTTYDVTVRHVRHRTAIKIDTIPPEEFLIARRAIRLDDDTPFSAHRKKITASDLIAMGFPKEVIYNLPSDDTPEYAQERTERLSEDETFPVTTAERADPASREIWTTECYARMDVDGDGYSELRKFLVVGEMSITVLLNEEINWNPFCSIVPIPIPHKFFGLSYADIIMDLQLIRSTLLRQILDNVYLQNNGRYEVVEGEVEIDDLLTSRPGGIVRSRAPGMVNVLPTPMLGPIAFNTMEFLEEVRENRTGVTRYNQGMDASSLNQTATGISAIMSAAQARIELIARIFAETGVKQFFKKLLRLMIESPQKEHTYRLRGEWVTVDPSSWSEDMDVEIEVGLGIGRAQEQVQLLLRVLEVQERMVGNGMGGFLVKPENVYAAAEKLMESMGFPIPGKFFSDPAGQEPPEPQPDPKLIEVQQDGQIEAEKLKLESQKVEIEKLKAQSELEMHRQELTLKRELELARIESQERVALAKCENDAERDRMKIASAEKVADKAARAKDNGSNGKEASA